MTLTQGYSEDSVAEMKDVVQRRVCAALARVPVGAPLDRKSPGGTRTLGRPGSGPSVRELEQGWNNAGAQ